MPNQDTGLAGQRSDQLGYALAGGCRGQPDLDTQVGVGQKPCLHLSALIGVDQVDLVEADHGRSAAVPDGDQAAIDERRTEAGGLSRGNDDRRVDIRRQNQCLVARLGIRPGQHAAPLGNRP